MGTHSQKHTWFYTIGWMFIFVGLSVFAKGIYNAQEVLDAKEFREVMAMLISLCGMLFTVSALFFTLDNLSLQRTTLAQQNESIDQQRIAIELQKNELKIQNEEMKASNEYFKQQNDTLKAQQFDATFFNMLSLHNEIVKNIDIRRVDNPSMRAALTGESSKERMLYGRDCFKFFYTRILISRYNRSKLVRHLDRIQDAYEDVFKSYQNDLGHYFRYLYNIIKFVDGSEIQGKEQYTNLVRAQLSSYELLMLFYNGLTDLGSEKFKPLIEKYHLLKNISFDELLDKEAHRPLYKESAYSKTAV